MAGRIRFLGSAATVLAILCGTSLAQTVAHFVPGQSAGSGGGGLALRVLIERADGREPLHWPARDVGWLFVREEGTQRNYDALTPDAGDPTLLRLERETSGAALVGWDLPARVEPIRSDELRAFVAAHATGQAVPQEIEALLEQETLPVRRMESLALIASPPPADGAPREPSAVATSKSGQRMELRALFDPSFLAAGSDFIFRLHLPEGGDEQLFVRAVHLASGEVRAVGRLAERGLRATLDLPGPWMIEAHRLRRLDDSGAAALELASATLVFDVRVAPARAEEGGGR